MHTVITVTLTNGLNKEIAQIVQLDTLLITQLEQLSALWQIVIKQAHFNCLITMMGIVTFVAEDVPTVHLKLIVKHVKPTS